MRESEAENRRTHLFW